MGAREGRSGETDSGNCRGIRDGREESVSSGDPGDIEKGVPEVNGGANEIGQWKEIRKKVEEEMIRKEVDCLAYWKGELEKVLAKKYDGFASFQIDVQNFIQRLQNRIKVLKSSLPK
jgi:hypothetical protein